MPFISDKGDYYKRGLYTIFSHVLFIPTQNVRCSKITCIGVREWVITAGLIKVYQKEGRVHCLKKTNNHHWFSEKQT